MKSDNVTNMSNTGRMSLAATTNAILNGTFSNDLVIYHANKANRVVVGVQGSSNTIMVSSSNTTINGPLVINGVSSNYPYCVYNSLSSTLSQATSGITASNSYIIVPSGVYMCTLSYNMDPGGSIAVIPDDTALSALNFGQYLSTSSTTANSMLVNSGVGATTMVASIKSKVKLQSMSNAKNQILALRRIF